MDFFDEGNFKENFYELVTEVVRRLKKVRARIKNNTKILKQMTIPDTFEGFVATATTKDAQALLTKKEAKHKSHSDDESEGRSEINKLKRVGITELRERRNSLTAMEVSERQYSTLRIAEFLESNYLIYPRQDPEV
mmetsp:Transcript_31954/g.31219  ORF Transcript_31954/g.31219 Transcript_31954/m.31219 type:complete len:136 (+) Transcript_31954:289-696(+)